VANELEKIMNFRCLVMVAAFSVAAMFSSVASAQAIDPEALKTARQLLDAMHASATSDQMVKQMMASMGAGLEASNPGKGAEVQKLLSEVILPEISKIKPELLDASANIYAANFSNDELKQVLAYYQSDIGRKMIERLPTLIQEQGQVARAMIAKMMPDIQAKLQAAIKSRGLNTPKNL
jgi:uncharacterized protein